MKIKRFNTQLTEIDVNTEDLPQILKVVNSNTNELNSILNKLTISSNMDAEVKTVTIPANTSLRVGHRLNTVPLYRLILKQVGGGYITDLNYTVNYIELKNNGATECTLTIAILRG